MATQLISSAQNAQDLTKINAVILEYSQAGDQRDVARLDTLLHPQYRSLVHRAFGGTDLNVMDKSAYLQLMTDKKIGGDTRKVHVLHVDVNGNVAQVKVILQGNVLKFTTYLSLVKMTDDSWRIVGDMPQIEKM